MDSCDTRTLLRSGRPRALVCCLTLTALAFLCGCGGGSEPIAPAAAVSATEARASSHVEIFSNLDGTSASTSDQTFDPDDAQTYNCATTIALYDSLGESIALTFYFRKVSATPAAAGAASQWLIYFAANGVLQAAPAELVFLASGLLDPQATQEWTLNLPPLPQANGTLTAALAGLQVNLQGFTQFQAPFSVMNGWQDGHSAS